MWSEHVRNFKIQLQLNTADSKIIWLGGKVSNRILFVGNIHHFAFHYWTWVISYWNGAHDGIVLLIKHRSPMKYFILCPIDVYASSLFVLRYLGCLFFLISLLLVRGFEVISYLHFCYVIISSTLLPCLWVTDTLIIYYGHSYVTL